MFVLTVNRTDGSGENLVFAKTVVIASGVYVNINNWLQVSELVVLVAL